MFMEFRRVIAGEGIKKSGGKEIEIAVQLVIVDWLPLIELEINDRLRYRVDGIFLTGCACNDYHKDYRGILYVFNFGIFY